jgi:hypothetical protein
MESMMLLLWQGGPDGHRVITVLDAWSIRKGVLHRQRFR